MTEQTTPTTTTAPTPAPHPADVVEEFHRAWTRGEIDRAMTLVAEDVVVRAPGEDLDGRSAYREFLEGFAPMLTGIGEIAALADGERVVRFYYPRTASTSTAPAAELFTVRDGFIAENVLIFDRMSYAPPQEER